MPRCPRYQNLESCKNRAWKARHGRATERLSQRSGSAAQSERASEKANKTDCEKSLLGSGTERSRSAKQKQKNSREAATLTVNARRIAASPSLIRQTVCPPHRDHPRTSGRSGTVVRVGEEGRDEVVRGAAPRDVGRAVVSRSGIGIIVRGRRG